MGIDGPTWRTTSVEIPASAGEHGPGRNHDVRRGQVENLVDLDGVVPADQRGFAQLPDVARQVVDEGIVVVDE